MNTENNDRSERDSAVSAVYRELATEETPPDLDRRIMEQAAIRTPAAYARGPRWTQPVAWAAMLVVTITIVLQVAETPTPPPIEAPQPAVPDDAAGFGEPRQDALKQADEIAREMSMPSSAQELRDVSGTAQESRAAPSSASEARAAVRASSPEPASLEAAEQACDDTARASPTSWLACIESLRESGRAQAADREIDALRSAFPEFELP